VARKALTTLLAVLGGGVLVPLLVVHRHDIGAALALLVTVCPAWLSVAALAEAVSYLTRGGALRAVLRGAAPTVGTAALAAITVVGDAVAYVLPFGFAAGGAVAVGQTHRRGAPRAAAVWGFAVVTLVGMAVLVALGVVAAGVAVVAAGPGALPSGPGLLAVAAVVVVVAAAVAVGRRRRARRDGQAQRHARWDGATSLRARRNGPAQLRTRWPGATSLRARRDGKAQLRTRWPGAASLRARRDGQAQLRTRWPGATSLRARRDGLAQPGVRREGATQPSRWSGALPPRAPWAIARGPHVAARLRVRWADLRVQPLPARAVGAAAVGMLLSWIADLSVLALAFVALGERPPWAGLVLAYCLGQAASALPFTPGGLAVVEGGLTATLVAFGGCPAGTLTAVLLYRLISHWAVVPAGGLVWLALRRRATDEFRAAPRSPEGAERCPTRT
jgi:uncharacterized membrane protein YbhN (UPF0104 family)